MGKVKWYDGFDHCYYENDIKAAQELLLSYPGYEINRPNYMNCLLDSIIDTIHSHSAWIFLVMPYVEVNYSHLRRADLRNVSSDIFQILLEQASTFEIKKFLKENQDYKIIGAPTNHQLEALTYSYLQKKELLSENNAVPRKSSSRRI